MYFAHILCLLSHVVHVWCMVCPLNWDAVFYVASDKATIERTGKDKQQGYMQALKEIYVNILSVIKS